MKMDQLPDLLNYKHFIDQHKNITKFNFTDANDIIQGFESSLWTLGRFNTVILLSLYVPTFIVGLFGNMLIIITLAADATRKANSYFMVNLALADLTVTVVCMPTSVGVIIYRLWVYGRVLCKSIAFIQGVAVAVSIFSMTLMAVDRYVSLQHPVTARRIYDLKKSCCLIICVWISAILLMGPIVFIRNVDVLQERFLPPLPFCIEKWPDENDRHAYGAFLLIVVFIVPAFTIAICYGQIGKILSERHRSIRMSSDGRAENVVSRKQAARMIVILICVFMLCWFPYSLISAVADLAESITVVKYLPFVLWLGHAHSAFNPMLYWSLNRRFRERVRRLSNFIGIKGPCTSSSDNTITLAQYG